MFLSSSRKIAKPKRSWGAFVILSIFWLLWSGLTGTFDGFVLWNAYRQIRAVGYSSTTGVVTASRIVKETGSDGHTDRAQINYTFQVAGSVYQGDKYRYGQTSSNDRSAARIVDEFPVGRKVDVYYAPSEPSDAVLLTGLEGMDLFVAMFLMPFNLVMIAPLVVLAGKLARRWSPIRSGGAKIIDDGFEMRIRYSRTRPIFAGMAAIFGVSFFGTFLIGFSYGYNPPIAVMGVAWLAIIGAGAIVFVSVHVKLASGKSDIRFDDLARTMTLPRTFGRKDESVVSAAQIKAIDIETIEERGPKDSVRRFSRAIMSYTTPAGSPQRETLFEFDDDDNAVEFAAWFRERLGMGAK